MAMNIDHALLLEEIRSNQKRLDECKRHHFPTWPTHLSARIGLKVDCTNCGGSMCALQAAAYARGYAAAGGDPNHIIPGWN